MKRHTSVWAGGIGALATTAVIVGTTAAAADPAYEWRKGDGFVELAAGGKPVWRFNCATNLPKPYFDPLGVPGGPSLTWNSPSDHVWHHGLWFSWKYINKVNYWESDKATGLCAGRTTWRDVRVETRDDHSARIALRLDYRPAGAAEAVLTEEREIAVSRPAADGTVSIDWTMAFRAGREPVTLDRTQPTKMPDGSPSGGYAGLGCRFARELQDIRVAAEGDPGPVANNRVNFTGRASEVNGRAGDREFGMCMLEHPTTPRAPGRWYHVIDPKPSFWFMNAAFVQREPFSVKAGESFTLRYRVIVHPGRWDGARLRAAADGFAK